MQKYSSSVLLLRTTTHDGCVHFNDQQTNAISDVRPGTSIDSNPSSIESSQFGTVYFNIVVTDVCDVERLLCRGDQVRVRRL